MPNLKIKTLDGKVLNVDVSADTSVRALKEKVAEGAGVPLSTCSIIYCGKVLKDHELLGSHSKLADGDAAVHLISRPQGERSSRPPEARSQGRDNLPFVFGAANVGPQGTGAAGGGGRAAGGTGPTLGSPGVNSPGGLPGFVLGEGEGPAAIGSEGLGRMLLGLLNPSDLSSRMNGEAALEHGRARLQAIMERARLSIRYLAAVPAETQRFLAEAATDEGQSASHEQHRGVTCDVCEGTPIRGPRWKCSECPDFDLCNGCYDSFTRTGHDFGHRFYRVRPRLQTPRRALGPMGVEMQAGERLGPSTTSPTAALVPDVAGILSAQISASDSLIRHLRELEGLARREATLTSAERRRADGLALAIAPAVRDSAVNMMDIAVTISNTRFGNAAGHAEVDSAAHTISLPPTYRRMFLEQQRQQDERSFQRRQDSTSPLPLHDDQVPQPQQAPQMMDGQHQHQNQLDRQSGAIDASSQAESRHNVNSLRQQPMLFSVLQAAQGAPVGGSPVGQEMQQQIFMRLHNVQNHQGPVLQLQPQLQPQQQSQQQQQQRQGSADRLAEGQQSPRTVANVSGQRSTRVRSVTSHSANPRDEGTSTSAQDERGGFQDVRTLLPGLPPGWGRAVGIALGPDGRPVRGVFSLDSAEASNAIHNSRPATHVSPEPLSSTSEFPCPCQAQTQAGSSLPSEGSASSASLPDPTRPFSDSQPDLPAPTPSPPSTLNDSRALPPTPPRAEVSMGPANESHSGAALSAEHSGAVTNNLVTVEVSSGSSGTEISAVPRDSTEHRIGEEQGGSGSAVRPSGPCPVS